MDSPIGPPGAAVVPRVASKARLHWDEVRERQVILYRKGSSRSTKPRCDLRCVTARSGAQIVGR